MGEEGPGGIPGGLWDRCGVEARKGCTGVMATIVVSGPGAVRDMAESREEGSQKGMSWEQSQTQEIMKVNRRAPRTGKEGVGGELL